MYRRDFTTLLSAGCSFTAGDYTWPNFVSQHLNLRLVNCGRNAAGNGFISRAAIYGANQILQTVKNSELLVGVMWSGSSRHEYYHNDKEKFMSRINFNFVDEGTWVRLNYRDLDWYSTPYFRNYYDPVGTYIHSLEHILRTQWFLESKKIEYFMTCYSTDVLPENEFKDNSNVKYLYDMINWDKFLPIDNCMAWCDRSGIPGNAPDEETREIWRNHSNKLLRSKATHPNKMQQQGFAEQVIIPFIERQYSSKEGENNVI